MVKSLRMLRILSPKGEGFTDPGKGTLKHVEPRFVPMVDLLAVLFVLKDALGVITGLVLPP